MNASISDETATAYAASLPDRVTLDHVVAMLKGDKIRGYQKAGEWFLDTRCAIQESASAPRLIRLGLFLLTISVLLLVTISVLDAAWAGFESGTVLRRGFLILGGAIGVGSFVVAIMAHMSVLGHRASERARVAEQGLELGHLGKEHSLVALLLGAFGLGFLAFYAGVFGVPGLIMVVVVSALVFLVL